MYRIFFLTVSLNNCRARAFSSDFIARNLTHDDAHSENTHGEGSTCAA